MIDNLDSERALQREEFIKREQGSSKIAPKRIFSKNPGKGAKPKVLTFEHKLASTEQWLEETFSHLFAADDCVPLDHQLLRDLKADYKNNVIKNGYPQDLVIKGALSRYKESYGYLDSIREGVSRYNLKGEVCGTVTKEEEEAARKILAAP